MAFYFTYSSMIGTKNRQDQTVQVTCSAPYLPVNNVPDLLAGLVEPAVNIISDHTELGAPHVDACFPHHSCRLSFLPMLQSFCNTKIYLVTHILCNKLYTKWTALPGIFEEYSGNQIPSIQSQSTNCKL